MSQEPSTSTSRSAFAMRGIIRRARSRASPRRARPQRCSERPLARPRGGLAVTRTTHASSRDRHPRDALAPQPGRALTRPRASKPTRPLRNLWPTITKRHPGTRLSPSSDATRANARTTVRAVSRISRADARCDDSPPAANHRASPGPPTIRGRALAPVRGRADRFAAQSAQRTLGRGECSMCARGRRRYVAATDADLAAKARCTNTARPARCATGRMKYRRPPPTFHRHGGAMRPGRLAGDDHRGAGAACAAGRRSGRRGAAAAGADRPARRLRAAGQHARPRLFAR